MKQKVNARQKRDAEALRRKEALAPKPVQPPVRQTVKTAPSKPAPRQAEVIPAKSPEEEAREFLEYLDRYDVPASKEEPSHTTAAGKRSGSSGSAAAIPRLDLEEGMPIVSEAIDRMHIGLQEMRVSGIKVVRLIHGYGSTGRGGKIRIGVREELAVMKRRKQICDFIPGEDFGPTDPASRALVERNRNINRDPDYGKFNHGITIVVL